MTGQSPGTCNLRWQDLLSEEEIQNWVHRQQRPKRLSKELAYAGVYRFVFPEARDGDGAHTPCYVGEAGKISKRLLDHFRLERQRLGNHKLRAGWGLRGSIRNSGGDFKLQVLTSEGPVNFGGLTSEHVDRLHPLNIPGTPHTFEGALKEARKRSSRKNKATPAKPQKPRRGRPAKS
jgi:hypothetical protein